MSLLAEKTAPAAPPPPPTTPLEPLNLSRRPFINTRPVARVAVVLWLLGLLLLLGNVSLFWSYLSGSAEKRAELSRLESQIDRESRTVGQLEARVANQALEQRNQEVRFLNRKIAERTFSWSLLFDRLAAVMPNGVRLDRLAPSGISNEKEERAIAVGTARPRDNRVVLTISGQAKSDEALMQFVDRLFAHPAFEEPDFSHETREDDNLVKFDIRVRYLPTGPVRPVVEEKPSEPPASAPVRPGRAVPGRGVPGGAKTAPKPRLQEIE